ncbi:MAG: GSU2403 family nucleotidyltransferase fold protein [Thermodesulfobacteriota bacterium]|nr:GSU2403 family nucleotidyltransferase fold protein [Thermodesulfobacteriota bacterium]
MEEKYRLLSIVLRELQSAGVLDALILAGSWCQYYYRILFDMAPEIPLIRTTDIDFLVPNPPKIVRKANVGKLLNNLGFDNDFDYHTGLVKYVHPDLEIQFLTPALGKNKSTPYEINELNINAEGLRYLMLLQDFIFKMKHEGITIWLPEPEAFVLQKILTSQKRKNQEKSDKDIFAAQNIGELCLRDKNRRIRLKFIFDDLPNKWQRKILNVLKNASPDMYLCLKNIQNQA